MSGAKARLAAAQILMTVIEERRTLDEALSSVASFDELQGPDRGFARAIASAALRFLGQIDLALEPFLDRPLKTAPPPSKALLRVGAAQAWVLDTPEHATVGETVAAAKLWPRAHRSTGFLNAVLRKVVNDHSGFDAAPIDALWPVWLRTMMTEGLGEEDANRIAIAQTQQPETYLTPKNGRHTKLAEDLGGKTVADFSVEVSPQNIESLAGYAEGQWWVQDVAAALPARLLSVRSGESVFDICAAPGGKTMQLASSGARVTAIDRSKPRLRRLKENLQRTELIEAVTVVNTDATTWSAPSPADKILLDAPCSALGTLRRNPEGAWIKTAEDVSRFSEIQERLLRASLKMLKPGGTLVYCVCSPLPHEGIEIVDRVISHSQVRRVAIDKAEIPGFESCLTSSGDVLTLPNQSFGHDAFFVSRMTRDT